MTTRRLLRETDVKQQHAAYIRGTPLSTLCKKLGVTENGLRLAFKRLKLPTRSVKQASMLRKRVPENVLLYGLEAPAGTQRSAASTNTVRRSVSLQESLAIAKDRKAGLSVREVCTKYRRTQSAVYRAIQRATRHLEKMGSAQAGKASSAKMTLAQQALQAAQSDGEADRIRQAIQSLISVLEAANIYEAQVNVPLRTYKVSYLRTEEDKC